MIFLIRKCYNKKDVYLYLYLLVWLDWRIKCHILMKNMM